jgi:hypothetical protein
MLAALLDVLVLQLGFDGNKKAVITEATRIARLIGQRMGYPEYERD